MIVGHVSIAAVSVCCVLHMVVEPELDSILYLLVH